MCARHSGIKRGAARLLTGVVAAGALTCAFAPQAFAASDALTSSHETGAAKWCVSESSSLQRASANNKSEILATVKLFRQVAGNAPNATLKHNMETLASRFAALAANYPHRPSTSVLTSDKNLEQKVVSEVTSTCFAAGESSAG